MVNTELLYTLPPFEDPEGSSVNISIEPEEAKFFVSIEEKLLKFAPKYSQLGTNQIKIILTDQFKFNSSSIFSVTVY